MCGSGTGFLPLNGYRVIHAETKTAQDTMNSLQRFLPPEGRPGAMYTDNYSWRFIKDCEDSSWNHDKSTPHRSETNGIAERGVTRVKEGTSTL